MSAAQTILVTGADGFVGRALCEALRERGDQVIAAVRTVDGPGRAVVGNLDGNTDWRAALHGCATVVHLAARVHVMSDTHADPLRLYREVNVEATLNLARQAHAAGVKRMVFVSSVKVNGEATDGKPFAATDVPAPSDPYGISKMEAEDGLRAYAAASGLEVVIVRPPLVYGPGVKANFLNLIKMVERGLPLPLGLVDNRRSMVALDNLVDLLMLCTRHPAAPGNIFMVSDGDDLSVAQLIRLIAEAFDKKAVLLPVPTGLMALVAKMLGKSTVANRLLGSLQVDIVPTRVTLEWTPAVTPRAAVMKTVSHYKLLKARKT